MKLDCPIPDDLMTLAMGGMARRAAAHVRECAACQSELASLRDVVVAVRAGAATWSGPATTCLQDDQVAAFAAGAAGTVEPATLGHVASCPHCTGRVASVARLLADPGLAAELRRLESPTGGSNRRRPALAGPMAVASLATAAALAIVFLPPRGAVGPPVTTDPYGEVHREGTITTTVAPRIVEPSALAAAGDSLRWTAVPHADRYEVKVFDRDATLVWNPWTTDTTLAIPEHLVRAEATTYLWKVEARTGWDRWVSSDWADLTIGETSRPR